MSGSSKTRAPTPNPRQEPLLRFGESSSFEARCDFCGKPLPPSKRRDRRFCRDLCRSRFHSAQRGQLLGALEAQVIAIQQSAASALEAIQQIRRQIPAPKGGHREDP